MPDREKDGVDLEMFSFENKDRHQKIIVSEELSNKHIARNINADPVRQYRIDGKVIKDKKVQKCDYLVLNDEKKTAYFIELKGKHLLKAKEQLEETYRRVKGSVAGYEIFYRLVYHTGTQDVDDSQMVKWRQKCGRVGKVDRVQWKQGELTENI